MRRFKFKKYAIPLVVVLALAAVGAASTNAISNSGTGADTDLGYVSVDSNGASISDVQYLTDDAGNLTGVNVTFASALESNDLVSIATNGGTAGGINSGGAGTDGVCTPATSGVYTTYDCTFQGGNPTITSVTSLGVTVAPQ